MKGKLASETVNYDTKHCVKSVQIRIFSGPYFPAFVVNMERYEVSLRIQSECWKIQTMKNFVSGHFSCSENHVPISGKTFVFESLGLQLY